MLPTEQPVNAVIDVGVNEQLRAQYVVDGYRSALHEVYGVKWYRKGDITKAKDYGRIKACADAMLERCMVPEHWALWRLRWFKKNVPQFKTKAPPLAMIMDAKAVKKWHGFFQQDFERPRNPTKMDYHRAEQLHRNHEARRRHEGYETFGAATSGCPKWYVEMRELEIMVGDEDPLARYPTRDKASSDKGALTFTRHSVPKPGLWAAWNELTQAKLDAMRWT